MAEQTGHRVGLRFWYFAIAIEKQPDAVDTRPVAKGDQLFGAMIGIACDHLFIQELIAVDWFNAVQGLVLLGGKSQSTFIKSGQQGIDASHSLCFCRGRHEITGD